MNILSRTISGAICLLLGFLLCYNSFNSEGFWVLFLSGLVLIGLGIIILFNEKEDDIEQIKISKTKRSNRRK